MTKIAIPSDNGLVSEHFGYCSQFIIFEIDQNKILQKTIVDNPGHQPGSLPPFLHEKGVNQVLAGGMGSRAIDLFQQVGIDVITGVSGSVDKVIEEFLAGLLKSDKNTCHSEQGKGCGHDNTCKHED
jgi:predicted Fe-Mo cluster-binding NifX family protein